MSTIDKLQAAVEQYVNEKVTDYAVMIDGVWGSGKTYFIKKKLFPALEKSNPDLKLIYISLFGVTGSSDLNRKIFLEVYPLLNNKAVKTVGVLAKTIISNLGFSGIASEDQDKLIESVGKIQENTVIVLDDLERLDGDLIIEILGFINQLVEHNNIRVIISANEHEMVESIEQTAANYKRYVEKVVRHKLLFKLNFDEIGNEIIASTGIDTKFHSTILQAFEKGESSNLRTLQFVCSMSVKILETLKKVDFPDAAVRDNVEGISLYFFASLAIDSKASRMTYLDMKKLASWSVEKPFDFSKIDFSKIQVFDRKEDEGDATDESPQQEYFDRYFQPNQMMYIDSLVEYLSSGFWDEKKFVDDIEIVTKYLTTKGVAESHRLLDSLFNFIQVEDDKIEEIVTGVLKYMKEGEYQIDKYLRIYFTIQSFIDEKIIKYNEKQLYKETLEGIEACKDEKATNYISDFISIAPDANERVKKIYKATLDRNQEIKAEAFAKVSSEHFKDFFDDPNKYNQKYLSKQGEFIPCFHFSCTPKEFLKKYSDLSNGLKADLNAVFYQRQKNGVQMDKAELEWMRELKEKLEKDIKKSDSSIASVNKKRFKLGLDKIISSWEQVEDRLDS